MQQRQTFTLIIVLAALAVLGLILFSIRRNAMFPLQADSGRQSGVDYLYDQGETASGPSHERIIEPKDQSALWNIDYFSDWSQTMTGPSHATIIESREQHERDQQIQEQHASRGSEQENVRTRFDRQAGSTTSRAIRRTTPSSRRGSRLSPMGFWRF